MAILSTLDVSLLLCVAALLLRYCIRVRGKDSVLDNIPGPPAQSFLMGNLGQYFDRHGWDFHKDIARKYDTVVKMYGTFGRRMLYVYDTKALYHILVKEEEAIYEEGSDFMNTNLMMFGPGLGAVFGEQHRKQRKMLAPVFSISHMRHMFPVFSEVTDRLCSALVSHVHEGPRKVDMYHWLSRAALEIIGKVGYDYSFDSLLDESRNEYRDALKAVVPALQELFIFRPLLPYIFHMGPAWFRRRLVETIPIEKIQRLKKIADTTEEHSSAIFWKAHKMCDEVGSRSETSEQERKDILSILIKNNIKAVEGEKLPDEEVIAQMSTFTIAAMDTTASTVSRVFHLLAQNQDVQENLRTELLQAGRSGSIPYDELMKLPYMDAIYKETLRVYPVAMLQTREVKKDTILPLAKPIRGLDDRIIDSIPLRKGMEIFVGVLGTNTSKDIWGYDALEWKPERWLSPLPSAVADASVPGVYSHLLTFSGGKRACIGVKFAELATKLILFKLFSNFTFELSEQPIIWNIAMVTYPAVGTGSKSEMPLKLDLLKHTGV